MSVSPYLVGGMIDEIEQLRGVVPGYLYGYIKVDLRHCKALERAAQDHLALVYLHDLVCYIEAQAPREENRINPFSPSHSLSTLNQEAYQDIQD